MNPRSGRDIDVVSLRGLFQGPRFSGFAPSLALLLALLAIATPLHAQAPSALTPDGKGNFTFKPGLRMQTRFTYDQQTANNDFFTARLRIKGSGSVYGLATYGTEIKIDNTGRFATATPAAQVENAWLEFPVAGTPLAIRAGFYDAPFSRDALTSDSKLLNLDRSLIKDALTTLGLADNTIGVLGHGRPSKGRFEYSVGVFDNLAFEDATVTANARQARGTLEIARFGIHLFDPVTPGGYGDYKASMIGKGRNLAIAVNGAMMMNAYQGPDNFDLSAWGADLFFNQGPVVFQTEYDEWREDVQGTAPGGKVDNTGTGWFVQGGVLVNPRIELCARYQERDADVGVFATRLDWTTVGMNYYLRDHNLKLQTEYSLKNEETGAVDNDLFQMQLQLDF